MNGHAEEFVDACVQGGYTKSNFSLAGKLTEIVLMGNLAVFNAQQQKRGWDESPPRKLAWDGKNMKVVDRPDLEVIVKREYRTGWKL